MKPDDIVFTSFVTERDTTITLYEGTPNTFGKQHIICRRPGMTNKIPAIKKAVENQHFSYHCKEHETSYREKVYCLGADEERPQLFMAVVVEYPNPKEGTIISAWPEKEIKVKGGELVYAKFKK